MIYNNDGPIYSSLNGKSYDMLLHGCSGPNCVESIGNLCNLTHLNGCPYDNFCGQTAAQIGSTFTGQSEIGNQPAALVCCSDLGFAWSFSQGFLDEQTWNSENEVWCSDYAFNNCGNFPVNDYNRCRYLMWIYGPTEAGDYCDRIDLYLNNQYDPDDLSTDCS